jgi:type IV pilus assembly protein PilX
MAPASSIRYVASSERGIALIVGLVILAVLSLIGVAAFSISTQEERMAGNSRDRIRAFEAAESALRNCETIVGNDATAFTDGTAGMYSAPGSSAVRGVAEGLANTDWQDATKVNLMPPNGSALGPSCVAEQFTLPNSSWQSGQPYTPSNSASVAHITARGYGVNPNTVVRLESYYAM